MAAVSIAADAGAPIRPTPFKPILRGVLITGWVPRFLRAEAMGGGSTVDTEPLWWPPAKIVGRYLAPFLARHLDVPHEPPATGGLPVDVVLEERTPASLEASR